MDAAFGLLVEAGLRATLVLGVGWVLTVLLRRASASARHFTWMCALVAAASMPAAAVVLPDWDVPSPAALRVIGSPFTRTEPARVQPAAMLTSQSRSATSPGESSASQGRLDSVAVAIVIWLAGALIVSGYALLGALAARRMRRKALDVTAPWVDEAHALAEAFEVPLPIAFVESPMTEVPMVCGLRRPAVVMPLACAAWPRERLRVALLHELAHVRRRDCAAQAFARAICALYWFSPLMWLAMRRLRDEREHACDDFVLAAGTKGSEYAAHLLEIARGMTPRSPALARAGLSMAHGSQLEGRLMAILNPSLRRSAGRSVRFASFAVLLLVSVPLAALHLEDPGSRAAADAETNSGGQASAAGGSQQSRFLQVDFVVVDTIVSDSSGQPVLDLRASDFKVFENSVEQTVESLAVVKTNATPYYLLSYRSTAAPAGDFRRIDVRVDRPGVHVASRAGYYAQDAFSRGAHAEDGADLVAPVMRERREPSYTSDAIRAKIQGSVVVEAVVGVDGRVSRSRVVSSLDKTFGLDDEALKAVSQWTFTPGELKGQQVPVLMRLVVTFRLH